MLRLLLPLVLLVMFVGWMLYRVVVKKDLKKHLNEVSLGMFFFSVWGLIYWWLA
jgi:hypothetical protein